MNMCEQLIAVGDELEVDIAAVVVRTLGAEQIGTAVLVDSKAGGEVLVDDNPVVDDSLVEVAVVVVEEGQKKTLVELFPAVVEAEMDVVVGSDIAI